MAANRADNHDRDKLARWHKDLISGPSGGFPAYAVFLVSGDDHSAHDVFRAFRSSFEERGAGFEHLVIFGQHGVSTALFGMMSQLGINDQEIPALALFSEPGSQTAHTLALTAGGNLDQSENPKRDAGDEQPSEPWREVLDQLEEAVDGKVSGLEMAALKGTFSHRPGTGSMLEIVERLLQELA